MSADSLNSNIFVYLFDQTDSHKRAVAEGIVQRALETRQGVISFQVVQETLNTLMRNAATPLTHTDARRLLDAVLVPLWQVYPSPFLYGRALDIRARFSFYDSLLVSAALEAGSRRLLTVDLQYGRKTDG